jgi:MFS family permease
VGFRLVAAAFAVTMLGTTLPTPLYVLYQRELRFSTLTSTVVFAVYAAGVLAALLLFGGVSDVIGRRPTLLAGLACAAVSGCVFTSAHDLPLLIAGRLLSGLSAGIFTGTATATLVDLSDDTERATLVGTVANMGGLGAGPLLSGLFAELAPAPLRLSFVVHLVLLAIVCAGIWTMPEPAVVGRPRLPRMTRPSIPEVVRSPFVQASIAGFAGFAVLGLCAALAPLFLSTLLRRSAPALAGTVVFGVFAASAVGQIALARRLLRHALPIGCAILAAECWRWRQHSRPARCRSCCALSRLPGSGRESASEPVSRPSTPPHLPSTVPRSRRPSSSSPTSPSRCPWSAKAWPRRWSGYARPASPSVWQSRR